MADNVLFEVDASQIVAKLHLAAVKAAGYKTNDEFFINTGIKNDVPVSKANPENPGKTTFDLKNTIGDYQLGFVTIVEYHKAFGLENLIDDLQNHLAKTAGDKSKLNEKPDPKAQKEFDDNVKKIKDLLDSKGIKVDDKKLKTVDGIKEVRKQAIDGIGKDDKEAYDSAMNEAKEYAAKQIDAYMNVFAGADNAKKVDTTDLGMVAISEKAKDPSFPGLVKAFEIQPATEAEKAKEIEQAKVDFKKNPEKKNVKQKICFYVMYSLDVDK